MRETTVAVVMTLCAAVAHAQSPAVTPPAKNDSPSPVRTGKERLGNKWSDEQRMDNCKVPPEKRGTKPRSDACPPDLTH